MPAVLVAGASGRGRELLGTALRLDGHAVLEAADGEVAWRMLAREPVTAAVITWGLAGGGAAGILAKIRETDGLRSLPVIVLAESAAAGEEALDGGADRVVQEPLTLAAIREAVEEAIAARLG